MSTEQSSHSEAADYVLRALRQSAQPLAATKLGKGLPKALKSKKDLPELLRQMVKAGQIRSHQARSSIYWLPSLEDQAYEKIIEALNEIPLTQTDLKNKLRSQLVGWPPSKRDEMLAQLLKEKRVYKVPPLTGKASLLSAHAEPTPHDYIRLALQLAVARLKTTGLTAEQVMAAAREVLQPAPTAVSSSQRNVADMGRLILERMPQINPSVAAGAPLQLSHLRRSLSSEIADKDIFDQAVMRLAEEGRVVVHRQDYVGDLSREELAALVSDGRGNYFTGIALKA